MTDDITLAYIAGTLDSDGYLTIKRSTYHRRVRKDAVNPTFSECVGLKQTCPLVPELLKKTFGGCHYVQPPQTPNSKPLHGWRTTDISAAKVCEAVLPYLLIKQERAQVLLELRKWKNNSGAKRLSFWWVQENPDWQEMEMLTSSEVRKAMGYSHDSCVSQALRNQTLVALPLIRNSHLRQPRFPAPLIYELKALYQNRKFVSAPQLIALYESLFQRVRELNKLGIHGTPVYHRTGPYQPAE